MIQACPLANDHIGQSAKDAYRKAMNGKSRHVSIICNGGGVAAPPPLHIASH